MDSAADAAKGAMEAAGSKDAASCIEMVNGKKYSDAVPVCMRAAKLDPDDERVQSALQTAQQGAAAASGDAMMDEATKGAMDAAHGSDAASEVDKAKGMMGK